MPLDDKQKTAFHEGGHCFRAWRANFLATLDTCIQQDEDGGWWGNTPVRRTPLSPSQRAEIALAGLLAEAKAIASDALGGVQAVATSDQLAADLAQLFVDEEIPVAGPDFELEKDDVWSFTIPIVEGEGREANVTLSDLVEIPEGHRTQGGIKAVLDEVALFLNDPVHWAAVAAIATALLNLGGGCLGHFMIYATIRTATDGLLKDVK